MLLIDNDGGVEDSDGDGVVAVVVLLLALTVCTGFIPGMLPFGFVDTFTSTLDFHTLLQTVYLSAEE